MIISASSVSYDPPSANVIKNIVSDIPIVLVTRVENFTFNEEELNGLWKYVLIDFSEYGWNFDLTVTGTHFFGDNTLFFHHFDDSPEWEKFDKWIASNPPEIYFKREILKDDVTETRIPIDYPYYLESIPIQTKEEFDNRPLSVMNFFGRSHEGRVRLHSEIWSHSSKRGYSLCDNLYHVNQFLKLEQGEKWASFHTPHFHRLDLSQILIASGFSKISIALPGAGFKTFRNSEISANSVMLMWENELAWSFPWVHNENCIQCKPGEEIKAIEEALANPNLYEIYVNGVANLNKYQTSNYTKYLESIIKEA